jgi:hypothetical protein
MELFFFLFFIHRQKKKEEEKKMPSSQRGAEQAKNTGRRDSCGKSHWCSGRASLSFEQEPTASRVGSQAKRKT